MKVHLAVISHRHGYNLYAARTIRALDKKVAEYCREWWGENGTSGKPPGSTYDLVSAYFNDTGNEWIEYGADDI